MKNKKTLKFHSNLSSSELILPKLTNNSKNQKRK